MSFIISILSGTARVNTLFLKLTAIISFIAGAIFFSCGEEIGLIIYKEKNVGYLIKLRGRNEIVQSTYN